MITPNIKYGIFRTHFKDDSIEYGVIECRITWRGCPNGFRVSTRILIEVNKFDSVTQKTFSNNYNEYLDSIKEFVKKLFENAQAKHFEKELSKEYIKEEVLKFIDPESIAKKKYTNKAICGERANDHYEGRSAIYPMGNQSVHGGLR